MNGRPEASGLILARACRLGRSSGDGVCIYEPASSIEIAYGETNEDYFTDRCLRFYTRRVAGMEGRSSAGPVGVYLSCRRSGYGSPPYLWRACRKSQGLGGAASERV